jgi:hypothetical protein
MLTFVLDVDVAEILAGLAHFTTPARFQTLLFGIASYPEGLEWLKHKHTCLRAAFLTSLVIGRAVLSRDGNDPP